MELIIECSYQHSGDTGMSVMRYFKLRHVATIKGQWPEGTNYKVNTPLISPLLQARCEVIMITCCELHHDGTVTNISNHGLARECTCLFPLVIIVMICNEQNFRFNETWQIPMINLSLYYNHINCIVHTSSCILRNAISSFNLVQLMILMILGCLLVMQNKLKWIHHRYSPNSFWIGFAYCIL